MTVRLQNDDTAYWFEFGPGCGIEKYSRGKWSEQTPVNEGSSDVAMAYTVPPESSYEHTFNWEQRYGELSKGKYRLVVHMTIREADGSDTGKEVEAYTLYVPFEL